MAARGGLQAGRRLRLAAPAKVNLGLRIVGRRPDGYHELESLFAPLDWADTVEVELGASAEAAVSLELAADPGEPPPAAPADASNLAARAAAGFLARAGRPHAVRVRLVKRLPVGAGLGGGSSDAGAVLRALSALLPGAVSAEGLAALALELGADVPFFLDPRPARVAGIGERIAPQPLAPRTLLLAGPDASLSTARVFRAYDALGAANREEAGRPAPGSLAEPLANDLEAAAVRLCPPIARLREALRAAGAGEVGMSGSGPVVFGTFPDRAAAAEGRRALLAGRPGGPRVAVWARVATTVQSVPLAPSPP